MKSSVARNRREKSTWSCSGGAAYPTRAAVKLGWPVAALAACALLVLAGCALPEVLALEHEVYEVESGVETLVNSGCDELPEERGTGFGFGFGTAPGGSVVPYSVSYEFQNALVRVSAGGSEGPSTEVEYDAAFLRSGGVDEIVVPLASAFELRLVNRAVDGCDVSVE